MTNEHHLTVLKRGVEAWNGWRRDNAGVKPDLHRARLSGANLSNADFSGADLSRANFYNTSLTRASFLKANLSKAVFHSSWLGVANLRTADLRNANFRKCYLCMALLDGADLREADLFDVDLSMAHLRGTNLAGASVARSNLSETDLNGANLRESDLRESNLSDADLSGANLSGANLVRTRLEQANLRGCRVYGTSVWDVVLDATTLQDDLVITPNNQPSITVDDLSVAQFMYLLLRNANIRHVIDTITSKVVLILGRFTPERKAVLNVLREELRKRDRLPVVFDFDVPGMRDTHETITTLARMARYIIADITDPRSIPQELVSIVEQLPSVAVQPILQEGGEPWGMYDHIQRYPWVLPLRTYEAQEALVTRLDELVIAPAEAKVKQIRGG